VTVKVGQITTNSSLGNLLSGSTLLELGDQTRFLNIFAHCWGASTTGQVLHDELGEGEALQADNLTLDARCGSVNDGTVMVDNFHDNGKLVLIFTIVDEGDTANLDEFGEYLRLVSGWMELPFFLLRVS
jgi:hypothetical protein